MGTKYGKCKQCGRWGEIYTSSGRCINCSMSNVLENVKQLRAKKGPYYEKWKKAMKKAVENL